jgi:hypothetical protein
MNDQQSYCTCDSTVVFCEHCMKLLVAQQALISGEKTSETEKKCTDAA